MMDISDKNYIIGSGYHGQAGSAQRWFYDQVWLPNTVRHANPKDIFIIATGKDWPMFETDPRVQAVRLSGDLGFFMHLIKGIKPYHFCGGTASVLLMALIAYCNECDFVYKEQDVLAFGPYVETMYTEIGTHGCIFGNTLGMPSTQSVMLVMHAAIPEFVRLYLGTPHESDSNQVGESKFHRLQQERPDFFCRYSFGVDRGRPLTPEAPVWFAQKFTPDDLRMLAAKGLIDIAGMPEDADKFSNA